MPLIPSARASKGHFHYYSITDIKLLTWPDFSMTHLSAPHSHEALQTLLRNYMQALEAVSEVQASRLAEMETGDLKEIHHEKKKCRGFSLFQING